MPVSSSRRRPSSQAGRSSGKETTSASTVGGSKIEARLNCEPPQVGQVGSDSSAASEIANPQLTQISDPTAPCPPTCSPDAWSVGELPAGVAPSPICIGVPNLYRS